MQKKYDAIIIGSGVIGCCVAFELAQLGYRTLSVDKLGDAGSFGFITPLPKAWRWPEKAITTGWTGQNIWG